MNAQLSPLRELDDVTPTKTVILAVEDDEARERIANALGEVGYNVIQVEDGYELFDCLELFLRLAKPAAIVAECSLSGRSGFELCQALAARPSAPAVILIASFDDEDAWASAEAAPAEQVINNPVDFLELYDALALATGARN